MAPKIEEKPKAKAGAATVAVKKDGAAKAVVKKVAPKKEEEPAIKEAEEDAPADKRKRVAESDVAFNFASGTLNVMPTMNGKLLGCLSEGGFQYLLAGVKTTAGLKGGRYAFEAKIVECLNPAEAPGSQGPAPKQLVRFGLSTAGPSVYLGDGEDSCCFDSEGFFVHGKKRSQVGKKFGFGETVAILVNLVEGSPNANTISLFKNGVRVSEPQALPEALVGKPLFPTVAYRNVTLQVNLGPKLLVPLPFECRMIKDAAAADVELEKVEKPKDGRHEAVFPVGMPNEGVFEWADQFLASNPTFTELSDRKIIDWATKSGVVRPNVSKGSKDSPELNFGIKLLDDLSVRKVISAYVPLMNRNFLVMELKNNLLRDKRKEALSQFKDFKKTAVIAMGEPDEQYKAKVQEEMLESKKRQAEEAKKKKAQEAERKKLMEEKKKKAEEAKKARLAAQKKKEGKEEEVEAEEEAKAEDGEKDAEKEEEEEKQDEDAKMEEPEEVELTEEEKKVWHKTGGLPDLSQATLAKFIAKFTLPEESDGFDDVKYVWQNQDECTKVLTSWVYERKMSQRVDDLEPGAWFKEQSSTFTKLVAEWKKRQQEWKSPTQKKALLAKKKEALKKDKEEKGIEEAEEAEELPEVDAETIEVMSVDDVMDIGSGEPLFSEFSYEDWRLLELRSDFHFMLHSWKKDLDDPDRPSFKENHFDFYYNKYFKKQLTIKSFGVEKLQEVLDFIKDTAVINESTGYFEGKLDDDYTIPDLLKLTEEARRDRQRRIDAGDEGAKIAFSKAVLGAPAGVAAQGVKRPLTATPLAGRPVMPRTAAWAGGITPRPAGTVVRAAGPLAAGAIFRRA